MPDPKPLGTHASRSVGGRPRSSSRRTLEDAASELFLEQGYAATTVDQIAQRAGVGRNTFFNYFRAKSDLLWIDADETLAALPGLLADVPAALGATVGLEAGVRALGARHPHGGVPIALSQREPMDTLDEFLRSGLSRFLAVRACFADFLGERSGRGPADPGVRACAAAAAAALASGAGDWAFAGVERGPLVEALDRAVAPVCRGFADSLG